MTKYWDIKPVCPQWRNHRHYRKLFNTFENQIGGPVTILKVAHPHICRARVIIDTNHKPIDK
jgi:hypothetical protein